MKLLPPGEPEGLLSKQRFASAKQPPGPQGPAQNDPGIDRFRCDSENTKHRITMDLSSFACSLSSHLDAGIIKFADDEHGMRFHEAAGEQAAVEFRRFADALRDKVKRFRAEVKQFLDRCTETDIIAAFEAKFKNSEYGDLYEVIIKSMRSFPPKDISRELAQEYIRAAYSKGVIAGAITEIRGELPPANPDQHPSQNL